MTLGLSLSSRPEERSYCSQCFCRQQQQDSLPLSVCTIRSVTVRSTLSTAANAGVGSARRSGARSSTQACLQISRVRRRSLDPEYNTIVVLNYGPAKCNCSKHEAPHHLVVCPRIPHRSASARRSSTAIPAPVGEVSTASAVWAFRAAQVNSSGSCNWTATLANR